MSESDIQNNSPMKDHNNSTVELLEEDSRKKHLSLVTSDRVKKLEDIRDLNWFNRTFRRFESGSLRGVVIMWIRMTLGIGILTLPYYIKQYGAVIGLFVLLVCALLNLLAYYFIFEASFTTNKKSYPELIEELLGQKILKAFRFCFILDISSAIMIYVVVSWNLFEYMIYFFGIGKQNWHKWFSDVDQVEFNESDPTITKIRGIFFYGVFVLLIPLFLKRDLGSLQSITIGYLVALFLLLIIILIELPFFKQAYSGENIGFFWFKTPTLGWIECFFGMCIAYYVQPYVFSLRSELLLPSLKRTKKISKISIVTEAIAFMLLGFLGYFALGNLYTPKLFILRKPYPDKNVISEYIFQGAIVLFFLLNTLGLAMYNPSLREYLSDMIHMKNEKVKYIVLSLLPFFLICTLAFLFPSVIDIVNFFGYTVNNFDGYIIPVLMKIKLLKMKKGPTYKVVLCYILLTTLIVMGLAGLVCKIVECIKPKTDNKFIEV